MSLNLQPTIALYDRRCYECGQWWASEHSHGGKCPECAQRRIDNVLEQLAKAERTIRSLRGALTRKEGSAVVKREICCDSCADAWRKLRGNASDTVSVFEVGESIRIVTGKARGSYRCDCCNAELSQGSQVNAVSVLAPGQDYFRWEGDYIEVGP